MSKNSIICINHYLNINIPTNFQVKKKKKSSSPLFLPVREFPLQSSHTAHNNHSYCQSFYSSLRKVLPRFVASTMEEQIPFKNLHSREYSGHKKKVPFCSLFPIHGKRVQSSSLSCLLCLKPSVCVEKKPLFNFSASILKWVFLVFSSIGAFCGVELHWHKTCFWLCGPNCANMAY